MVVYSEEMLHEYLKDDWILKMMDEVMSAEEKEIRTNQWLYEMEPKRLIYADVYGDLLKTGGKRVLDVGGGYNALTKVLGQKNDYHLLDFMAHGGDSYLGRIEKKYKIHWINEDWFETKMSDYDVIVANDIFPDVDQRMELFIEKAMAHCKELRLVITFYNNPRYYLTKRTNDLEMLTFLSWDGEITALKLRKYINRIENFNMEKLENMKNDMSSIYWNGRQVYSLSLKGDLA